MDPVSLAAGVVTYLTPFLPTLMKIAKESGGRIVSAVNQTVGEFTIEQAQTLWKKIVGAKDTEIETVAQTVADLPENEDLQKVLAKLIANKLNENPNLVNEVIQIMGGQENVQQVIALRKSWVEDIVQKGLGQKEVRAEDESVIKKVRQIS